MGHSSEVYLGEYGTLEDAKFDFPFLSKKCTNKNVCNPCWETDHGIFFIILNHISEGSKVFFLELSSILNIETEFVESAKNMSTEIEIAEKST